MSKKKKKQEGHGMCPRCKSTDVERTHFRGQVAVYQCNSCPNEYEVLI